MDILLISTVWYRIVPRFPFHGDVAWPGLYVLAPSPSFFRHDVDPRNGVRRFSYGIIARPIPGAYLLCQTRWCPCIDIMPSKPPPVLEPSLGTPRRHRSQAAQLAELYWMSLTRDVPFSKYGEDEDTIAAAGKSHSMPRTRSTRLATACCLLRHFLHANAA